MTGRAILVQSRNSWILADQTTGLPNQVALPGTSNRLPAGFLVPGPEPLDSAKAKRNPNGLTCGRFDCGTWQPGGGVSVRRYSGRPCRTSQATLGRTHFHSSVAAAKTITS